VVVAQIESGSAAARAGLRRNDVVTAVNRQPVASTDELRQIASQSEGLILNLLRGQGELLLVLR
jgi:S1-C subfamily serine protease